MRRNKYGAIRTSVDGITFASAKEARRYGELKILQKAGIISNLQLQVKMPVVVNGVFICNYFADFAYLDHEREAPLMVFCDVKGMKTPVYRLKKKLVEALYRTKITET